MDLEDLEGIEKMKVGLKEIINARELNFKEAFKAISEIRKEYNSLLKEKGVGYCIENCPEIPALIKMAYHELGSELVE